jgi:two-component system, response regulator PdtaR
MFGTRLSLALGKGEFCEKVKAVLTGAGYSVIDTAASGSEALRKFRVSPPDIAVVNYELTDMNGLELSTVLAEEGICRSILLAPQSLREICEQAAASYDILVLEKPLHRQVLVNAIENLHKYETKLKKLEDELEAMRESMRARIIIDKAKGAIMDLGIEENTAYTAIRRASMDKRIPMKEIAQMILDGTLTWRELQ